MLCSQLLVVSSPSSAAAAAAAIEYWATTTAAACYASTDSLVLSNDTQFLNRVAAIDPAETLMREQTQDLLQTQIPGAQYRTRQLYVSTKDPQYDYRIQLAQISTPRYIPFWPEFKKLLREWSQIKLSSSSSFDQDSVMHSLLSQIKLPIDHHYKLLASTGTSTDQSQKLSMSSGGLVINQTQNLISSSSSSSSSSSGGSGKYQRCAVVGNSGILLQKAYGSFIDAHDMVMRLNNARTVGYEKFVGSKTTISFVNSNILHRCSLRSDCFCHPYGAHVPLVVYMCQVIHMMDIAVCRKSKSSASTTSSAAAEAAAPLMLVTDPRFDKLVASIVKWYSVKEFMEKSSSSSSSGGGGGSQSSFAQWNAVHDGENFHYSSGMQAVMLALGICEEVNLFGFGKENGSQHHYHTQQRQELGLHDYEAEYRIYQAAGMMNNNNGGGGGSLLPFLNGSGFHIPPLHVFR